MDWLSRQLITTQADLNEERDLLNRLLLELEAGVTYLSPDFTYQIVNPYFAHIFGRRPEDFVGKQLFSHYPETEGTLGPAFRRAVATGQRQVLKRYPLTLLDDNRENTTYFDTTITPIHDSSGQLMGLLTLCLNVTDSVLLGRSNHKRTL